MSHISIIVCSRTPALSVEMQQNIADSIGVDYELIVIDNSRNEYTIFTAYNEGVRRASCEVLCFVHDDVLFRCNNWGGIILEHFCDSNIGIIGVAGSHFLPSTPMYWCESPFVSEKTINNDDGLIEQFFNTGWFKEEQKIIEVCVVDGLCLFAQRSIFKEISFDEATFNGFHMYDMDICMQALSFGYKVCVCRDVLVEHRFSFQRYNNRNVRKVFNAQLELFNKKWHNMLPLWIGLPDIPQNTFQRLNQLCQNWYCASKLKESKSYKIGHFLLSPIINLKKII